VWRSGVTASTLFDFVNVCAYHAVTRPCFLEL
jgi:hypothetical protein